MLRDAGVEVINLELVGTEVREEDLTNFENLAERVDEYDGVFFTSPVAAQVFVDRVKPQVRPALYALGKRAAAVLGNAGFDVRAVPYANTAVEMLAEVALDEFTSKKLLFVRGNRSMRTIPERLGSLARVDEVVVYRTIEIEPAGKLAMDVEKRLSSKEVDWLCFFSPSAVEAFRKRFGVTDVKIAVIGETTAARAGQMGFTVGLVASGATNQVFARELIERIASA